MIMNWMPLSEIGAPEATAARIKQLIADLPVEDSLYFAALVNAMLCNEEVQNHRQRQWDAVSLLNLGTTSAAVTKYVTKNATPFVLTRVHMLELMKWICAHASGANAQFNTDSFLTAAVMAAHLSAARHDVSLEDKDGLNSLARLRQAVPAIREKALWGLSGWYPLHSLGRVKSILMDRMFENQKYSNEFKARTDITLEDFVTCMAGVATLGLGAMDPETGKRRYTFTEQNLWSNAGEFRTVFEKFFSHFSQTSEEFKTALNDKDPAEFCDFKFLRRKPILRLKDGTCLIPDPVIFGQCLAAGPIFEVLGAGANEIFGAFGDSFEDYSRDILRYFHSRLEEHRIDDGYMSFNRRISVGGGDSRELSDVTVTVGETLVLIETKGVWVKDEVLSDLNPDSFWKEINTKYGTAQSTKDRNKGFAQLADSIQALADGADLVLDKKESEASGRQVLPQVITMVYPVLLVHDAILNSSGWIPHLLAVDFAQIFGNADAPLSGSFEVKGTSRTFTVANLIVCTIQELELLVAKQDQASLLAHFSTYSTRDTLRLMYSFDMYVHDGGEMNRDWSPLVRPSQAMMLRAGDILMGRPDATKNRIERRAYELWLARGQTHGNDVRDWFDAELELGKAW